MSCHTNEKPIDLPASISFASPSVFLAERDDLLDDSSCEADKAEDDGSVCGDEEECKEKEESKNGLPEGVPVPKLSITMPSSHVVEISQTFYWPLYTAPIDWIHQEHISNSTNQTELNERLRRTAEELQSMSFFQSKLASSDDLDLHDDADGIETVVEQLKESKEDWFGDLSGGQKSKVELVREIFLRDKCPNVVLIDETLAPLDPTSKTLVMSKLKNFCKGSIIIVIYHADIGHGKEEKGETIECVPSSNFFDHNIHLEDQIISFRPVC